MTGRISASEPNLLGVPRDGNVRRCFVAAPGYALLDVDYSNIDLRVLAQITGDQNLRRVFNTGGDVHRQTAARMLGKPPDQVTDDERRSAKPVNFGVCFGMGPSGLVESALKDYGIVLSEEQAAAQIDAFMAEYPGVRPWQQAMRDARPTHVRTLAGRVRHFDGANTKLTEQLATVVQGTTADGFKRAIGELCQPIKQLGGRLVLAPHDELLVEVPEAEVTTAVDVVKAGMIRAMKVYLTDVDVTVNARWGSSWASD